MTYTTRYPKNAPQTGRFCFIVLVLIAAIGFGSITQWRAIQRNGVWKAYAEKDGKTFHWLCLDPETRTIFDLIVEKIDEITYREKTALVRTDGRWTQVDNWLRPKGGKYADLPQRVFSHKSELRA